MEIIVGYLFDVLYYKRMLCVLIKISSLSIYLQDKKISLNYPYIVFGIPADSRTCSTHPW